MKKLTSILTEKKLSILDQDKVIPLSKIKPNVAKVAIDNGLNDKVKPDDTATYKKVSIAVKNLRAAQTEIIPEKAIGMAIGMMLGDKLKIGGDLGSIMSSDNYIMDGHHRWAATFLCDPTASVTGTQIDLDGISLVSVLNIITKGVHNRSGNAGKGNIKDFKGSVIEKIIDDYATNGIGGEYPISAEEIKVRVGRVPGAEGDFEAGKKLMMKNADALPKAIMPGAPARIDMPVIKPEEVEAAAKMIKNGEIDMTNPFSEETAKAIKECFFSIGDEVNESDMSSFIDTKFHIEPRKLEVGKEYVWFMGAEPLTCTYEGPVSVGYSFKLGKSSHKLSRQDVSKYIFDLGYLNESVNESLQSEGIINMLQEIDAKFDLYHHNTKSFSQHKGFDQISSDFKYYKDDLIEKIIGYTGERYSLIKIDIVYHDKTGNDLVNDLLNVSKIISKFSEDNQYADLKNIADSISRLSAKLNYLMTLNESQVDEADVMTPQEEILKLANNPFGIYADSAEHSKESNWVIFRTETKSDQLKVRDNLLKLVNQLKKADLIMYDQGKSYKFRYEVIVKLNNLNESQIDEGFDENATPEQQIIQLSENPFGIGADSAEHTKSNNWVTFRTESKSDQLKVRDNLIKLIKPLSKGHLIMYDQGKSYQLRYEVIVKLNNLYESQVDEGLSSSNLEDILSTSILTAAIDFKHGNVKEAGITPLYSASKWLKAIERVASNYAENEEDPEQAEVDFNIKLNKFVTDVALKKFGWTSEYMLKYYAANYM